MKNIIIVVVIVLLAVFFLTRGGSENTEMHENSDNMNQSSMNSEESPVDDEMNDGMNNEVGADIDVAVEAELAAGTYEEYSPEKVSMNGDKDVVLFFKADWCPSCRALDNDIKESLNDIPANAVILDVDYDQYTDLRQRYGVTTQHTLVQVDAEGNMINKWSGGNRLESVVENIQ